MERLVVRVEAMLGALEEAVVATDLDGTIVYWNAAAEALYGWTAAEAVGRSVQEMIVPEGLGDDHADQIMKALRSGQRWAGEFPVRRRDGTVFIATVTDSPVLGETGDVVGVVGVSSDASERRWVDALRRGDSGLRLALAAARVGTWRYDAATNAVEWDAAMESLFGVPAGGFARTLDAWLDLVHPDDRDRVLDTLGAVFEAADEFDLEHRLVWPDGSVRWIEGRGRVTRGEDGALSGSVGVAVDVTDRKHAERALREEHQIVETLHHVGRSVVAELDLETIVQSVTDAATELTGAEFGAFFYNVVDAGGEAYVLYTISGVAREAFSSFPMPRNTDVFAPTFSGESTVRSDDITRDPRYGRNEPYHGMPPGHLPVRSYLAVPVISRSDEVLGGLFFGHQDVGVFDERDERLVAGIAAHAAVAIDNARLYNQAQEQRRVAETAASRLARLHALAVRLGEARSVDQVADAIVSEGATALGAAAAMLCALGPDGRTLDVLDSRGVAPVTSAAYSTIPLDSELPVVDAYVRGETILLHSVAERNERYPALATVPTNGRSFAIIPVEVEGRAFGALALAFPDERSFSADDRSLFEAIGLQGGQALGRARLADAERRAARTLQQSLLPPGDVVVPGLDVAARYHAFGDATEVGGDFYDAFPTGDGSYGVVMGDVRGKGIQSAAVTALARYTVRAASQCERSPSDALRLVNQAIYGQDDPERFCTVVHLHVRACDSGHFELKLSCAGHPLPLLLTAAGDVRPVGKPGMVVGLFEDPDLHDTVERLAPGDALVLYTDGVLEARSPDGRFDAELIEKALTAAAGKSAEEIAAAIERAVLRLEGGELRDDMALLVLRVPVA